MNRSEFEDVLNDAGVFYNGLRGPEHKAHMDSYMTCVNWEKLSAVWESVKDSCSMETWVEIANNYRKLSYLSPNCKLLHAYINNKLNIPYEDAEETVKVKVLERAFVVPKNFNSFSYKVKCGIANFMYGGMTYSDAMNKATVIHK